jgi:hypothetical protein
LIFGVLYIQPFFPNHEFNQEQTCVKTKCTKEEPPRENEDCNDDGCNPFVPCPMGSCCYLVENFFFNAGLSIIGKQKIALFDDNRLLNKLSECWHPPERLS